MKKISTGINDLDKLIDSAHIGDNVVWEVEAGTSEDIFMHNFISNSVSQKKDVIYVSFNRSPQSILLNMKTDLSPGNLTLLDCFTSGKGKNDRAFQKFYETGRAEYPNVIKVNRPGDIPFFSETINTIQDKLPEGARYIFDSLTGMQDLWGDENSTYKFFTYMCPRLYDLGTVAYWILEKEAHSQTFKANLRHITQVVIDLSKKRDKLFLKALKLDGRTNREAFKPHSYEIEDNSISIAPVRKEPSFDIGGKIKDSRIKLGLSQKDLAEKIGMTSSFISQIENNQISPSLNSFLQISSALDLNPTTLLQKNKTRDETTWLVTGESAKKNLLEKHQGYAIFKILSGDRTSAYLSVINAGTTLDRHFLNYKKEELIHVLKGKISVRVNSSEKELRAGDTIHLRESLPSLWKNKTDKEVELLVICT